LLNAANTAILCKKTLNQQEFENLLYTKDCPNLDMVVRTGGQKRLSNFLLYQAAYAELFFVDTLWPDFGDQMLDSLILEYAQRQRKFGKID